MKKQLNSNKKQWVKPSIKGQLEIKETRGAFGKNESGGSAFGKS
jgi:hypothetical protein